MLQSGHSGFKSLPRHGVLLVAGLCGLFSAMSIAFAQEQITAKMLIGDAVSEPDNARYSDVTEAIKRYTNRDVLGARTFLETARRKDEKLPPVDLILAKLHLLTGNTAAGQSALEQVVTEEPTEPEPYLVLAEQAFAAGQTLIADALFDKAVELIEPYESNVKRKRQFEIRAYAGRASIAERRQKWEQAEADLRKWLEADPENATAHQRLGQVLFMLDKSNDGYQEFVTAEKLSDKLPKAYVAAAMMYDRQQKNAEAKEAFERAFTASKSDETTLVAYAQWLVKTKDIAKAETVLAGAQKAVPNSLNVWLLSGVAAMMANKPGPAEQYLTRAMALAPSNRDVNNLLALLLVSQPDAATKARAAQFAAVNQKLYQDSGDTNITLAWVMFQLGQGREATVAFQNALRIGGLSADGNFLVAKLLLQREDRENAKRYLEAALASDREIFVQRAEAEALKEKEKL